VTYTPGTRLATLLDQAHQGMIADVVKELARRGHPGVTATLEFALVAIRAGAHDASALGRALRVSKQAAAKTIATLEQLGYVARDADPADGRRKLLVVSDRGEQMTAFGARAFDDVRDRWIQKVGAERVEQAEDALQILSMLAHGDDGPP
jgi:DNA-binding MarR family transcriptional regulator